MHQSLTVLQNSVQDCLFSTGLWSDTGWQGHLEVTSPMPAQVELPPRVAQGLILPLLQVSGAGDHTALLRPWSSISTPCTVTNGFLLSSWCKDAAYPTRVPSWMSVATVQYWPALPAVHGISDV